VSDRPIRIHRRDAEKSQSDTESCKAFQPLRHLRALGVSAVNLRFPLTRFSLNHWSEKLAHLLCVRLD
jgi:hypothetical protein